ncbi:MAG: hypothetical protein FJ034_01350, partial [Chloroflexi bacterium]|nr:hypothetical protein [Chloroflexota bacterium]
MLSAVHTDRTGRVYVSADYSAAAWNGLAHVPAAGAPLPDGTAVVPVAREAIGLDRNGRPRPLGRNRWALAATLPSGWLRTLHPSFV